MFLKELSGKDAIFIYSHLKPDLQYIELGGRLAHETGSMEQSSLVPRPHPPHERVAWYPLFAHARNLPEILVNRELSCSIRI